MKKFIVIAVLCVAPAYYLSACTQSEGPDAGAVAVTEINLSDVPQSVKDVVMAKRPDFVMSEVVMKVRDGRTYYDVEGELPGGDEIEFDVLMTEAGPQIVEVQRDMAWADVSQTVRSIVDAANTDNTAVTRVIESVQTDGSIIYEIFVAGKASDPSFEVQVTGADAKLLTERAEH